MLFYDGCYICAKHCMTCSISETPSHGTLRNHELYKRHSMTSLKHLIQLLEKYIGIKLLGMIMHRHT